MVAQGNSGVVVLDATCMLGSGMPGSRARAQQLHTALATGVCPSAHKAAACGHPELQVMAALIMIRHPGPHPGQEAVAFLLFWRCHQLNQ